VANTAPKVHIAPFSGDEMENAVRAGGGEVVDDPSSADIVVWANPRDPQGLKDLLAKSDPKLVQLPFAGIESFFAAGVIDEGRAWTCAKGIYGHACAEHALALMLAAARRLHEHVRATSWRDTTFGAPERRLSGLGILIFGAGGIGRALVPMLQPLGARITTISRSGSAVEGVEISAKTERLPELVEDADFAVVTASLTPETEGIFDASIFKRMKPDAWIVNVARGGLIKTDDLVDAIKNGVIGGAALDVTDPEPLPDGHPLWSLDNAIITPHVANTWDMAVPQLIALVERNVANFKEGRELEGIVDVRAGY
jgi:D-3-phosphoglycerate dehydrogenase